MDDVQPQFVRQRISKFAGMAPRGLSTNENLTVRKSNYIRRAIFVEKLSMQRRDPAIGNNQDRYFPESG